MVSPFFEGQILWASVVAYVACFVLAMAFLRYKRVSFFEALLVSLAAMFSGIYLYEIAYHYMWGLEGIWTDLLTINLNFGPTGSSFPLLLSVFVSLTPFLAWRYIRAGRPLLVVSAASVALFAAWYVMGFQQFYCVCESHVWNTNYYIPAAEVESIGIVMNSLTKLLSVVPAFLFFPYKASRKDEAGASA